MSLDGSKPSAFNFSLKPPSSSTEDLSNVNDSSLMDDNLTTGLLTRISDKGNGIEIFNDNNLNDDRIFDNDADNDGDRRGSNTIGNNDNYANENSRSSNLSRHSSVRLVMRKIGMYLSSIILLLMLLLVPIIIYSALSNRKLDIAAWHSALIIVMGTLVLSIRLIYLHLTHWYMPNVQKYVVRIILMVPIYAIQSWLSLRFHHARIYIDSIRDLYEAFVIVSFVYYLIELLGGEIAMVRILLQKARIDPSLKDHLSQHAFPLNLILEPWDLGVEFMLQCKHGVLQYVVAKIVFTLMIYIFQSLGMYGEGEFVWTYPYPYLAFLMNISVMYALYSLVKLFHAIHDELRHPIDWHPFGKFLCVKGVVFFTWWQGVLIFYLKARGIIEDIGSWTGQEVANGLIDYCVCVEMVGFAIAHSFTFTYKEYLPSTIEEAMAGYDEEIQRLQNSTNSNIDEGNNSIDGNSNNWVSLNGFGSSNTSESVQRPTYHPPEVLERPMKVKDAFWSSTVPKETLKDIRRLQRGVVHSAARVIDPGAISLPGTSLDEPDVANQQNDDE